MYIKSFASFRLNRFRYPKKSISTNVSRGFTALALRENLAHRGFRVFRFINNLSTTDAPQGHRGTLGEANTPTFRKEHKDEKICFGRPLGRPDRHDGDLAREGEVQLRLQAVASAVRDVRCRCKGMGRRREGGEMTDLLYALAQAAAIAATFAVALAAG